MIADEHKMKIFSKDEHFMSEYFQGNTFQFNSTQLTDGRTNGRTDGQTDDTRCLPFLRKNIW